MRLRDPLIHPLAHAALTDVTVDQHHKRPVSISDSNTVLTCRPLPGGPAIWDIPVDYDAAVAIVSLRSLWRTGMGGANAGVQLVCGRNAFFEATACSMSGPTLWTNAAYGAFYSKGGGSLTLSHKMFTTAGMFVALSEIQLQSTGPSTRVLRLEFTNYGSSDYTLSCWLEAQIYS